MRYADDFLLGFAGPKSEAEAIRDRLSAFLAQELGLELSAEKTLITHANTEKARFLGYDISVIQCDTKITGNRRSVNGGIALRMPPSFVAERSRSYTRDGKPIHRKERTHDSDYSIVCQYQAEYRGFVQYYQFAANIAWLSRLHWVMRAVTAENVGQQTPVNGREAGSPARGKGRDPVRAQGVPGSAGTAGGEGTAGRTIRRAATPDKPDGIHRRPTPRTQAASAGPNCSSGFWRTPARRVAPR